ncbi:hypothetical protein [uncultured Cohaesibacter sp.]|uniref:hypothetical protein n=1 Tax=uncultured Cohaesibacter sp. TaxID=1002546 RepID=UPI0029C8DD28|nr:hypothetical protein [uncultured Cohaesibacter sp.]
MSRRVSMNARMAFDAQTTAETEVALFVFEHENLTAPLRLSTDPTERLSADPLMYGTRSTWDGADPQTDPYLYVLMSAEMPGDLEDTPASSTIVLENVDNDIAAVLRGFTNMATVHMAMVLASSPDLIEVEYRGMKLLSSEGNGDEVRLTIGRRPIEEENVPMDRTTKQRFPGSYG